MADSSGSTKNIKDLMRVEYAKCARDPLYFIKKYVKIQHPTRGTLPFLTYEFQDMTLEQLIEHNKNIILKSRQMGITTLVSAYALWLMTFHSDKEILCISITQETSKAIVTKVRFANDNLPSWLRLKAESDNQLSLKLVNGSQIKAVSSSGTSGRSSALSLLIIDEAAFIDGINEIWLSVQSTLSTGGKAIVLSTPNGVGNFFHQTWIDAEAGLNEFNTISLPWHLHPERKQAWRDEQTKLLGERGAAQECDCEFSTSGNTVVEIPILDWYLTEPYRVNMPGYEDQGILPMIRPPLEKRGIDKGYWIWGYPQAGRDYMISVDVGRGDAADFSAAQITDIETLEQVAEYKGKISTGDFARNLMVMGAEYFDALLIVENANIGWAVIQILLDEEYPNLFYSSSDLQYVDAESQMTNKLGAQDRKMVPGFTTSTKTRPLLIAKLESYIREKSYIIHSSRLIEELKVFVWKSGSVTTKAEAMTGYNDDLVLAAGIGMWIRDIALRLKTESGEVTRKILGLITSTRPSSSLVSSHSPIQRSVYGTNNDPWKMKLGGAGPYGSANSEDLRWLIR
jgi:hypothetical protein